MRRTTLVLVATVVAVLGSACGGSAARSSPVTTGAASSPSAAASGDPAADDLGELDGEVRAWHPDPFATTRSPPGWRSSAELRTTLPGHPGRADRAARQSGRTARLALVVPRSVRIHLRRRAVPVPGGLVRRRAKDRSLVGSRLVSIGGHPRGQIESALRPLVPADNESGELIGLEDAMSTVEYLHGLGIVDDPASRGSSSRGPDGIAGHGRPGPRGVGRLRAELGLIGDLMGDAHGGSRAPR